MSRSHRGAGPAEPRSPGLPRVLGGAFTLAWRAHRSAFAGRLAVTVLGGAAPVVAAALLRIILDDLADGHSRAALVPLVVALGLAGGVTAVLGDCVQYLGAQSGRAIQRRAIADLFGSVARLRGLARLEDPSFQNRLGLAQQAGTAGASQMFSNVIAIAQSTLTLAGFLVTLVVLSRGLAVIVLAAAIPGVFAELGLARRRVAMMTRTSNAERRQYFYASLLSDRAAAQEIRLFGLGVFFRRRMLDELRTVQRENERVDRRQLFVYAGLAALSALVAGGGLGWAVLAARGGALTVGDLSLLVSALGSVAASLTVIVTSAAMTYQALLMCRCYAEVMAEEPDLPEPARPEPLPALRRGIEVRDVWFRYGPGQPWILRGVSLFIPHGQALALVGHNGAGKSTLVKLLCRFYDPDRGQILWDGVDLRDTDLSRLRDRISVVFQDYMRYEISAADNIAVGDLAAAADPRALTGAARRAGLHDVLTALPKGYDTLLTRAFLDSADSADLDEADVDDPAGGVLLSGGQWQRLGLARSFLRSGRDLVILDEPSSGLDAEAEYEIHRGLRADQADRATVLISHRLNTVRDADQIAVLRDGLVAERGDHDTLMAAGGTYARLFTLQARGYADGAADLALSKTGGADG